MKNWIGISTLLFSGALAAAELPSLTDLSGWSVQSFVGETQYQAGPQGLTAEANATASALGVEQAISAGKRLLWTWAVDQLPTLEPGAEQTKQGDDFGARVYVVRKGLFGLLSTQSLVYVWSQQQPPGTLWDSPYTSKVKMMAVQPATATLGEWHSVERDLAADWQRAFGRELDQVDGVALMVDADNSQTQARARFGQLVVREGVR